MSNEQLKNFFEQRKIKISASAEDLLRDMELSRIAKAKEKSALVKSIIKLEKERDLKREAREKEYPYNPPYSVMSDITRMTFKINKMRKYLSRL